MLSNCVSGLVRYQISVLSDITHFKVRPKATDNMIISSCTVSVALTHVQARTYTSTEPVHELSIIARGSPGALCLVAGWWMSLPWAALLKRLSIRPACRTGPHIWLDPNGSQLLPVITHTAWAGDATEAAIGARSLTRWGSHFQCKRGGYYVTHVQLCLTWVVLHLAEER